MTRILIGAVLIQLLAIAGITHYAMGQAEERGKAEERVRILSAQAITWQSRLQETEAEIGRLDQLLLDREIEREHIASRNSDLQAQIEELKNVKPEVKAWADTIVPDDVLNILRQSGAGASTTRSGEIESTSYINEAVPDT